MAFTILCVTSTDYDLPYRDVSKHHVPVLSPSRSGANTNYHKNLDWALRLCEPGSMLRALRSSYSGWVLTASGILFRPLFGVNSLPDASMEQRDAIPGKDSSLPLVGVIRARPLDDLMT